VTVHPKAESSNSARKGKKTLIHREREMLINITKNKELAKEENCAHKSEKKMAGELYTITIYRTPS